MSQPDPFVELSLTTFDGLNAAIRELGWIVNGGDPSASMADRSLANLKLAEYEQERVRVLQRLTAFRSRQIVVAPPSNAVVAGAQQIAATLASFVDQNVTASTVIGAATQLLEAYGSAK